MNVPWSEAQAALDKLGCTEFMDREMGQLSGGQRKRVALAAALIEEPDLLAGERGKGGGGAPIHMHIYIRHSAFGIRHSQKRTALAIAHRTRSTT